MHYHIVKSTKRAKETQKQTRYQQQSDFALCWLGVSAPVTCPSTANYRHKINRTNFRKDICAVLKERRSKHSHFINRKDISFTVTRDGDILLLHPSPAKFHGDIVDALHRGRRREWGMGYWCNVPCWRQHDGMARGHTVCKGVESRVKMRNRPYNASMGVTPGEQQKCK